VDRWYEYLKSLGVKMRSAPHDNTQAGVRAFGFFDSEGYTLEVFSWLKK
ncbi:MAG: VOC family protein, partial [Candidatus Tectomicrobia bacterium]|nr:VOC family protein [Candidatus Tectomicrobia bacterium]